MNYIKAYEASDGTIHKSLEEMKKQELSILFEDITVVPVDDPGVVYARWITENSDKVLSILTLKPNSVPALRKPRAPRKPKKHVAEQFALPLDAPTVTPTADALATA